jgi:hypothetical protein
MQQEVNIIATVSEALKFRKQHPSALSDEILANINPLIREERNESTKLAMIIATSRALDFLDKHPSSGDKQALQHVMASLPEILQTAASD